jgi:hypothetical protein
MENKHKEQDPGIDATEVETLVREVLERIEDEDIAENLDATTEYAVGEEDLGSW